ncbi:MAG: PAS domain S-box protein [Desulfotignum sp.]|nr:PAS domain S-box protein [Desulfotignum sp.]
MAEKPTYEELETRVQELKTGYTQLEKKLHEAELFSEEIMTYMSEGLVQTDIRGNVIFINQRLSEMLGYLPEQIIGKYWLDIVPAEQQAIAQEAEARRVLGHTDRYEIILRHKDGHRFPVMIGAGPRFDKQSGEFIGTMGVVSDITDQKKAEKQIAEALSWYQEIFEGSKDAIFISDENARFVSINSAACNLTGYDREELRAMRIPDLHDKMDLDAFNTFHGRIIGGDHVDSEARILRRDGRKVDAEFNNKRITVSGKHYMHTTARDITERKWAEKERDKLQSQLLQAQKMESVGRLAGGVAHDFNNMLGVILGHTELALLKTDEDNDLISNLKEIQNAAKRSANTTKQLLAFARKDIISPKQIDLNDTVESMLNMLRRLIGEDIDLVWQPAAHLWPVKMDPSQIDQILANLCVNARDAISGVGKLTIETGKKTFDQEYCNDHPGFIPGDFVLLAVSDNGSGMDKETLENLFEPFFTTKEVGKGTGLGLATVYGIVKQNNGFINVYSEPGQGSTFKIYLPRLVADEDVDKAVPEKKAAAGGSETILLVEDEPTILRMTRMMLERKGLFRALRSHTC